MSADFGVGNREVCDGVGGNGRGRSPAFDHGGVSTQGGGELCEGAADCGGDSRSVVDCRGGKDRTKSGIQKVVASGNNSAASSPLRGSRPITVRLGWRL